MQPFSSSRSWKSKVPRKSRWNKNVWATIWNTRERAKSLDPSLKTICSNTFDAGGMDPEIGLGSVLLATLTLSHPSFRKVKKGKNSIRCWTNVHCQTKLSLFLFQKHILGFKSGYPLFIGRVKTSISCEGTVNLLLWSHSSAQSKYGSSSKGQDKSKERGRTHAVMDFTSSSSTPRT